MAAGLSAVTGKPVSVRNIRENRPRPGLAPQHLAGLKALAKLFNAHTRGIELGSTEIKFMPQTPSMAHLSVDVGTAGSIGLMLQTLMIPAPFLGQRLEVSLTGGTHVSWSPNTDYLAKVTIPILRSMGYNCGLTMISPGYYPKGGGRASFTSDCSKSLRALRKDAFGKLESIQGISRASNLPKHVARRQAASATETLSDLADTRIDVLTENAMCPGSAITLWAATTTGCRLGASALGKKGKPAESVGGEAGQEMLSYIKSRAPVDPYLLDQIVPYAVMAKGKSVLKGFRFTMHAKTNIHVVRKFIDCQIDVEGEIGQPCTIKIQGSGFEGGIDGWQRSA